MGKVIVDGFAGGGGTSLGFEWALGRSPDFAINHNPAALAMHEANHPDTIHLPHNVWQVSLKDQIGNRQIGALWVSPDCRHHSKAKGGAPVSAAVRDLAWVVMRWLKELRLDQRPDTIYLENVEEFKDWCPLITGEDGKQYPDMSRRGETFKFWLKELKRYGYKHIDYREIRACVLGSPTIRKRFYLIASRHHKIVWPEDTHARPGSDEVVNKGLRPWPVSADIIDFTRPCPSILMTAKQAKAYTKRTGIRIKRPLEAKSEARVAKGVKKHVIDALKPFIVTLNHAGDEFRGQSVDEPFATVTRARDAHGVVMPSLVSVAHGESGGRRQYPIDDPMMTVTGNGRTHALVEAQGIVVPHVSAYYGSGNGGDDRTAPADEPLRTVTTAPRHAVVQAEIAPFITYAQQGGASRSVEDPHHTVTASRKDQNQMAAVYLKRDFGKSVGNGADEPVGTVTAGGGGKTGVVAAYIAQHNGGPNAPIGRSVDEPLSTTTTRATQQQLVAASMISLKGNDRRDADLKQPHNTVCAGGGHSAIVTMPLMTAYYSEGGQDASISDPMLTVPTKARFGLTECYATNPPLTRQQLASARRVAKFLRKYGCWDGGEIVTIQVGDHHYIIIDIGMRMLTPRELARAQGFPDSYILAAPFEGKLLNDTQQRHMIGNSVCPHVAAALIAANSPELMVAMEAAE